MISIGIKIGVCFPESSEIFIQNWYYANYWSSKFKLLGFVYYTFLIIHYNLDNIEFIKCQSEVIEKELSRSEFILIYSWIVCTTNISCLLALKA